MFQLRTFAKLFNILENIFAYYIVSSWKNFVMSKIDLLIPILEKGSWSSKEPRLFFIPVAGGNKEQGGRAGLGRQAPPSSYLPAAFSLLPPQPGDAWEGLLPLPLMSGNCLLSWRRKIR